MYEYMTDFNNAEPQYSLIPAGTVSKAMIYVRRGNYGVDELLTKSEKTGSIGLSVEFTITEGQYQNRKIFQLIGVQGTKKDESGKDVWGSMGCSLIRGILESAHNISHNDSSERAQEVRNVVSFNKLQNLKCLVKIGVEVDKTGQYPDKNKIVAAITNDHKEYDLLMNNSDTPKGHTPTTQQSDVDFGDELPF